MELKKRHPALIVLKALLDGAEIKLPETGKTEDQCNTYTIGETEDGFKRLCITGTRTNTQTEETKDVLLAVDMPLDGFINMCEKMTDDDIAVICANNALNLINRKKR